MIAACSLVSVNVAAGFGKHDKDVDPREFDGLGMRNMIVGSMLNLSAAWSKTSFAVSLLRIATPRLRIVIWLLIVSMNILMHAGVVIGWVACHPVEKFWKYNIEGECWPAKITLPISIFINGVPPFSFFPTPFPSDHLSMDRRITIFGAYTFSDW